MFAFIQNLNGWELPLLTFFVLLLFGGKKLPELARGAAKAIAEFKKVTNEAEQTFKQAMDEEDTKGNQDKSDKNKGQDTA